MGLQCRQKIEKYASQRTTKRESQRAVAIRWQDFNAFVTKFLSCENIQFSDDAFTTFRSTKLRSLKNWSSIKFHDERQDFIVFFRKNALSGTPIINGTNQLPLEMENSLTTKSPQRTVRTTHIVYGSPEKIKTSFSVFHYT